MASLVLDCLHQLSKQGMQAFQLRSALDLATVKLMNDDESGVRFLQTLISAFPESENFYELSEAREIVAEIC